MISKTLTMPKHTE